MSNDLPKYLAGGLVRPHLVECGYWKILQPLIAVPNRPRFLQEKFFFAIAAK